MADDAAEPKNAVSPAARRFAERREAFRAAVDADRERVLKARSDHRNRHEEGYGSPVTFCLGLLVLLLLFAAGWFIIDKMRCDPFYSNVSRLSSHTCQ